MVYSTVTVTSVKGLVYVLVLVRVSSQRVFWLAVVAGVAAEDAACTTVVAAVLVLGELAVVVGDEEFVDVTVVGAFGMVDLPTSVVDVDVEDVTDDVVTDWARRPLVDVVGDMTAAPKMLSSATQVQGWPLISDKATRRT